MASQPQLEGIAFEPGVLVEVSGPDPSSALERLLWDRCYKFAMSLPDPGSMNHVEAEIPEGTFSDPVEVDPPSPSATLVGEEPSYKWQEQTLGDRGLAVDMAGLQLNHQMHIKAEPHRKVAKFSRGRLTEVTSSNLRVAPTSTYRWKSQGYTMLLRISQTVPDEDVDLVGAQELDDHFRMLVDTGSCINWILGSGYLEEEMKETRPVPDKGGMANSDIKMPREAGPQPYRHRLDDSQLPPPHLPPPVHGPHAQGQFGMQPAIHPQHERSGHQGQIYQPVLQAVPPTSLPTNQPPHYSHFRQQPVVHPNPLSQFGFQQSHSQPSSVPWSQPAWQQPHSVQWLQPFPGQWQPGLQPYPLVQWQHPAGQPPSTWQQSQLPPPIQWQQPGSQPMRSQSGEAQGHLQHAMPGPQIPPPMPAPPKAPMPAPPIVPPQLPPKPLQHQRRHRASTPPRQLPRQTQESAETAPLRQKSAETAPFRQKSTETAPSRQKSAETAPMRQVSGEESQASDSLPQGNQELPSLQTSSKRVIPDLYVRAWKNRDRRDSAFHVGRPDHCVLENPPVVLQGPGSVAIDKHIVYKKVMYMDGNIAHLALIPEAITVEISESYRWTRKGRTLSPISIPLSCGAAFAVSYWFDRSTYDDILGFGLLDVQQGFEGSGALTFLAVLKDAFKVAQNSEHSHYIVMYLALRPSTVPVTIESWIAWINWPLEAKPRWCTAIPVVPYNLVEAQSEASWAYSHWTVPLVGMRLLKRSSDRQSRYELVPNGDFTSTLLAGSNGVEIVLDTGTSLSYVPSQIINQIKTTLFPSTQNQQLNDSGIPFIVLDEQWDPSYTMEYTFRGENGANIVVHGDADPFLCTRNPHIPGQRFREGLVLSIDTIPTGDTSTQTPFINSRRWLFGMNFFHTMYVGLCKPHNASLRRPYVLLAPQRASEVQNYRLPKVLDVTE